MLLLKRAFLTIAAIAASMVLITGCKSTPNKPAEPTAPTAPAAPAPAPPAAQTNQVQLPPDSGDSMKPGIVSWDATEKTVDARPGDLHVQFTFSLTNVSSGPIAIYDTSTTCDC